MTRSRPRDPLRTSSLCWFVATGLMAIGLLVDLAGGLFLLAFAGRVAPGGIDEPAAYRRILVAGALVGALWVAVLAAIVILTVAVRRGSRRARLPLDIAASLIVLAATVHLVAGLRWMPGHSLMGCAEWLWILSYCACIVAAIRLQHRSAAS